MSIEATRSIFLKANGDRITLRLSKTRAASKLMEMLPMECLVTLS